MVIEFVQNISFFIILSKTIKSLKRKELLIVKENEKFLLRRNENKRPGLKKTEDGD